MSNPGQNSVPVPAIPVVAISQTSHSDTPPTTSVVQLPPVNAGLGNPQKIPPISTNQIPVTTKPGIINHPESQANISGINEIHFPTTKQIFSKSSPHEVKAAIIMTMICLIIVIGFTIRKYRKLRRAGKQVRDITNTVFPVRIVSLYLYIFLLFPIVVFMQFLACIAPLGYGSYSIIQSIYESISFIWLWELFVEYFGGSEQIVGALRRTGPYNIWKVPPFMISTGNENYFKPNVLIISFILTLQYMPVNVVITLLKFLLPVYSNLFNIPLIISLMIAFYGIMLVYWPSKEALQPYQGGWKLGLLLITTTLIVIVDIITKVILGNFNQHSFLYMFYWRIMLTCGVGTIGTLVAAAVIDSREIYQIYNLPIPSKDKSGESKEETNKILPK
ncbi:hypothetical protein ACR3K2_27000 [Cryptosporidium serpentis]